MFMDMQDKNIFMPLCLHSIFKRKEAAAIMFVDKHPSTSPPIK